MASYIPGLTDYIPQAQPFTPDYNFLGNVLQTKQSRYDSAHKQLNKMYGTLLYSPMLREDNIQQRDQFFKMIDQDIKKMSGLDLSLQQNVDAASNVFTSLYDNKNIVKDMTFTKQYQNQLSIAENYRNCLDQEKCGGGYWDVGVNALNYRAQEFKNASLDEAMGMQAPEYAPFINVTEKAVKYFSELKKSGFGVTNVSWSPDGKYIVTTKDGKNLQLPLEDLLQNQFGNDPKIQQMYQTQAYVQRKNYIMANKDRFGGDEGAAENEYVNSITNYINEVKQKAIQSMRNASETQDIKAAFEKKIKTEGTTGDDAVAEAWRMQDINYSEQIKKALFDDESAKIASAVETNSENKKAKASYVDALIARTMMGNDFKQASITIANLNVGETKVEADPYAKSYYDHSLRMTEKAKQHEYSMEEALFKAKLEMVSKEASGELKTRGPANTALNNGRFVEGVAGTSAASEKTDEAMEAFSYVKEQKTNTVSYANDYVERSTEFYRSIISGDQYDSGQKTIAKKALKTIWGDNYDDKTNTFNNKGNVVDYNTLIGVTPITNYNNAVNARKELNADGMYSVLFEKVLDPISAQYDNSKTLQDVSTEVFKKNNTNVKSFAVTSGYVEEDEKVAFNTLFDFNNNIRSKDEYVKMWSTTGGMDVEDAGELYDEMYQKYTYVYNSGNSMGVDKTDPAKKVPLVSAIFDGNKSFGMFAEGKSSGGGVQYAFDASAPASFGTRGLLTFAEDGLVSKGTLFSSAIVADQEEAEEANDDYIQAMNSITSDIKSGAFDINDKERPFGTVTYLDLALSDPNYKAIHIDFAPSYIQKYRGTESSPGWGDNDYIKSNGITMYVPKKDLNNDFTQTFALKPYDIILNHRPVVLDKYKNAGNLTITKMNDGRYNVTGELYDYSSGDKVVKPAQNILSAEVGGHNLVTGYEQLLAQIDVSNTNYRNKRNAGNLIYDPRALTPPRSIFEQSTPQQNPFAMFE